MAAMLLFLRHLQKFLLEQEPTEYKEVVEM